MDLATRIAAIIAQKKMKQSLVAKDAGITPQMLCDMLHGRRIIRPEYINRLCASLGVSPNDLFASSSGPPSAIDARCPTTPN